MTLEQITKLFPLTVKLNQELINKGQKNIDDCGNCVGALALKKALGKNIKYLFNPNNIWGNISGTVNINGGDSLISLRICSYNDKNEQIAMMEIEKPLTVTFKIKEAFIW